MSDLVALTLGSREILAISLAKKSRLDCSEPARAFDLRPFRKEPSSHDRRVVRDSIREVIANVFPLGAAGLNGMEQFMN